MKWPLIALAGVVVAVGALAMSDRPADSANSVLLNPNHSCSNCHNLHGGAGSGEVPLGVNAQIEALCLSCHGPGGPSVLKADNHVYDNSTCADCHVSHDAVQNWLGGSNIKLVRDSVLDPLNSIMRPVVFESRGVNNAGEPSLYSFGDNDEDGNGVWDGVCATCHTNIGRHNYDEPNSHAHQTGNTCTRCHEHVTRFKRK